MACIKKLSTFIRTVFMYYMAWLLFVWTHTRHRRTRWIYLRLLLRDYGWHDSSETASTASLYFARMMDFPLLFEYPLVGTLAAMTVLSVSLICEMDM